MTSQRPRRRRTSSNRRPAVRVARNRDPSRPILVALHGGRELDPDASSFEHLYAESAVAGGAAGTAVWGGAKAGIARVTTGCLGSSSKQS